MLQSGRKFLVVIDSTPECMKALQFASLRAKQTGAQVVMVSIVEPEQFQHWVGIAETMLEDQKAEAQERLEALSEEIEAQHGFRPECVIRTGRPVHEIRDFLQGEPNISILVLGASNDKKGPGQLVTRFACESAVMLPIPITIIPESMSFEDLQMVC